MSIIATLLVLAPAAGAAMTAEQAMARARAATSIGPDPCRTPVGDEIVVCGRRESPYALPLYEPVVSDDGVTGRERENMTDTMMNVIGSCNGGGEVCLSPLPIVRIPFGRGRKPKVVVGQD